MIEAQRKLLPRRLLSETLLRLVIQPIITIEHVFACPTIVLLVGPAFA